MRWCFPLIAGLAFGITTIAQAAPKTGDRPSGPALVGQAKSWTDMVALLREGIKTVGGPKLLDTFDKEALPNISPKIFPSINPEKPFGLYGLAEAEPLNCRMVLMIPIRAGSDFLKQLSDFGIKTEKIEGDATFQIQSPAPIPMHLKFKDDYAYISLGGADALGDKKIVASKDVFNTNDKSPAVLSLRVNQIPDGLKKFVLANAVDSIEQSREMIPEGEMREAYKLVSGLGVRWIRQIFDECKEITLRLDADPKTANLKLDLAITPIAKSALASAIASRPGNTNAFGALVNKDSVQWIMFSAPMFHEDLRDALIKLSQYAHKSALEQNAKLGDGDSALVMDALFKSLTTTLKSGSMDVAAVLRGPNANGHYSVVSAIQLSETEGIEKAVKAALKNAPEAIKKLVKLDAEKLGEANIHEISMPEYPESLKALFGPDLKIRVGVFKNSIVLTIGPDSKAILAEIPKLKPVPAPGVETAGNFKGTSKLIRKLMPAEVLKQQSKEGLIISGIIESMEKTEGSGGMSLSMTGGESLHITLNYNIQYGLMGGPFGFMMWGVGIRSSPLSGPIELNEAPPAPPAPDKAKD